MAVRVGVLHDFPAAADDPAFEQALLLGIRETTAQRERTPEIEIVTRTAEGLPRGSAEAVGDAFRQLVTDGVVAVVGPAISDNALAVAPVVAEARVPCINYTGSERTRGEFAFHYQIGSLEEEPFVIARRLSAEGLTRVALLHDRSFIGDQNAAFFEDARRRHGIELAVAIGIAPDGEDAAAAVDDVRAAGAQALVYLGLGMSAVAVGRAMADVDIPVVANASLMFGYAMPDWTPLWEGWTYIDAISEANRVLGSVRERWDGELPPGPAVPSGYDMGRLVAEGIGRAPTPDGPGVKEGLEQVKQLPAALGMDGTLMGFGRWERSALKGEFLVLRVWRGGRSRPWSA